MKRSPWTERGWKEVKRETGGGWRMRGEEKRRKRFENERRREKKGEEAKLITGA